MRAVSGAAQAAQHAAAGPHDRGGHGHGRGVGDRSSGCRGPCAEQQPSWACSTIPSRACSGSQPGPGYLLLSIPRSPRYRSYPTHADASSQCSLSYALPRSSTARSPGRPAPSSRQAAA